MRHAVRAIALVLVLTFGIFGEYSSATNDAQAAGSMKIKFMYDLGFKKQPDPEPIFRAKCDAWKEGLDSTYSQIVVKDASDTIISVFNLATGNLPGEWIQSSKTGVWACQATFYVSVPTDTFVTIYNDDQRITTVDTHNDPIFNGNSIDIPDGMTN